MLYKTEVCEPIPAIFDISWKLYMPYTVWVTCLLIGERRLA